MALGDIAAWIGAGAWLPQIFSWFHQRYSKPILTILSVPTIEVGYTTFGNIINMTSFISTQRKDAIIEKIVIEVAHSKGETRVLTWKFLNEIQQQITSYSGESLEISKNQPAIALKVSTLTPAEKIIGFQDLEFQSEFKQYTSKVLDFYNFHKKKGEPDQNSALKNLLNSREYSDLLDYYKKSMYWKEGDYIVNVRLKEITTGKFQDTKFKFTLAKSEIEILFRNLELLDKIIELLVGMPLTEEKKKEPLTWGWAYPEIKRAQ